MSNMSYCRFQNTLADLEDCYEHLADDMGEDEDEARRNLIKVCKEIVEEME